ncbi:SSI family serine proteinase inhibitor [Nocardia transvalensis]|uniref:SSI family serine proteinase inhibitor n=1 Tax=Nocardia transvalensis TaxID=37333 RepID=UPI001893CA62|nr:hypothetical protein [Nocardia transvalensis]
MLARFIGGLGLASIAAVSVIAVSAGQSAAQGDGTKPQISLTLSIYPDPHQSHSARGNPIASVNLRCEPQTGNTHPQPDDACPKVRRALEAGGLSKLRHLDEKCTKEFKPVTVTARGHWFDSSGQRRTTDYVKGSNNRCLAEKGTDNVFRFGSR